MLETYSTRFCFASATSVLPGQHTLPNSAIMVRGHNRLTRTLLVITGALVIAASPLVGVIPGPGGIFVFAAGLVLVLQNSNWAKRNFAGAKRRWPRFGHYADMALRRQSFRRRQQRAKELALEQGAN
jgi:hypothetical protein